MARFQSYECPDCSGRFRFMHHPNDEPPPNFCPLCGSNMTQEPVFVPTAPHIRRSIGTTADTVYRQMEEASVANMAAAAELTGGDAADFGAGKITDMADYLRPGDVAAKMPDNPVSRHMANTRQGGFQPSPAAAQYSADAQKGVFPRQGEMMRSDTVSTHTARARQVEARGIRG